MFYELTTKKYYNLTIYFIFYSFLGWCLEIFALFLQTDRYIERGFVYGPFCIMYGFGIIGLLLPLRHLKAGIPSFFLLATLLISAFEYITGELLLALFQKRWWDYSYAPYNLNGHICLKNSIFWGIIAVLIVKYLHNYLSKLVNNIPLNIAKNCSSFILIFFTVNIVLSLIYVSGVNPYSIISDFLFNI